MSRISRDELRLIREAQGVEAAANAAGVRKTKKVVSKSGRTYYRPLTPTQRKYRLSNIIQGKQAIRRKKKNPTQKDKDKLKRAKEKITESRLNIPDDVRVASGRRLQIKEEIRKERRDLKTATDERNRRQKENTIKRLQEELRSEDAEEDVQRAYENAQDTDQNEDWNLFKQGYNATTKRQRTRFKKALKERLGDGMAES